MWNPYSKILLDGTALRNDGGRGAGGGSSLVPLYQGLMGYVCLPCCICRQHSFFDRPPISRRLDRLVKYFARWEIWGKTGHSMSNFGVDKFSDVAMVKEERVDVRGFQDTLGILQKNLSFPQLSCSSTKKML